MAADTHFDRLSTLVRGALTPPPGRARIALALTFGAAVNLFFAAAVLGMSRSFGTVPWPLAFVTNAFLLLQFPLVHSFLLTGPGMQWVARLVPGPHGGTLGTTTYAIIASVQLLVLFALWTPSGIVWWRAESWAFMATTFAYAASWALLIKASWDAGAEVQSGALGWMSLLRNARPRFPDMPTGGLFRIIRQPIYVAFALTLWTVPVWTPDQLALAVCLTAYCLAAPRLKERRFEERYGDRSVRTKGMFPTPSCHSPEVAPVNSEIRNNIAIYDEVAASWWSDDIRWVRTLKNLVPGRLAWFDRHIDWRGKRILDLGCAGGFMAEALAARGAMVTGIDPAAQAVAAARARAAETGQDIRYDVGVGEALPYAPSAFDAVVCVDVLEHVSDPARVLAEIERVLTPGGVFLYDTINRNLLSRFLTITVAERLLGLLPRGTHDPDLFIKPRELEAALRAAGLVPGDTKGLGPRGVNRRGDFTFGPLPVQAIIYMGVARKRAVQPNSNVG